MIASFYPMSHSKQTRINNLFQSRLKIALFALTLQALILIPLIRSILFVVAFFNIPAISALIACTFHNKVSSCQAQRTTKFLLKIGVAKTFGGIFLALYVGLKYVFLLKGTDPNTKAMIEMCTVYLGGSALVDVLYSILATMAIKRTKKIIKILKRNSSVSNKKISAAYIVRSSSEGSSSCSSEEESSEKITQNSI